MRTLTRINNVYFYTKDGYIQTMGKLSDCIKDLYDDFGKENGIA